MNQFKENTIQQTQGKQSDWFNDISLWRVAGTYLADTPEISDAALAKLTPRLTCAAVEIAASALQELVKHGADENSDALVICENSISRARNSQQR